MHDSNRHTAQLRANRKQQQPLLSIRHRKQSSRSSTNPAEQPLITRRGQHPLEIPAHGSTKAPPGDEPASATSSSASSSESDTEVAHKRALPPIRALGGLREDPFRSYPIDDYKVVGWAIDYWVQIFAPKHGSLYTLEGGRNWLIVERLPHALQSDIMLEGLILYMLTQLPASYAVTIAAAHTTLLYRASVVRKLRRRLSNPATRTDNTTLNAVMLLMAADFHMGEDKYVETHQAGLRRIVELRGGFESGDIDQMTRFNIIGTETICDFAMKRRQLAPGIAIRPGLIIKYPKHPFSPELCQWLARIPRGFQDFAVALKLSTLVIKTIHTLAEKVTDQHSGQAHLDNSTNDRVPTLDLMRCVLSSTVPLFERVICLSCLVLWKFLVSASVDAAQHVANSGRIESMLREHMLDECETIFELKNELGTDFLIWGVLMLSSLRDANGLSDQNRADLMNRLLDECSRTKRWNHTLASAKKFFWNDNLVSQWHVLWQAAQERKRPR